MSDAAQGAGKRQDEARLGGGGLRIYKPGQGYYTRVGTAIGIGVLSLWGTLFLSDQFATYMDPNTKYFMPVRYGVCLAVFAAMCVLGYWIVGLHRRANEFFIATEGEMKKVSWISWPDLVRSTQVVVISVLVLGLFLFVVDIVFMEFFAAIGVLKGVPSLFGG